ncbi:MAG: DUF4411 family protein [Gemmatimonadota bacterium]|nr:DUF4411 family protein [Gemmatimonadota bacterium]
MLFLLDANVLIDAGRDYYAIERVPEFWDWLEHQGVSEKVKIPQEIYEEVEGGRDSVATWLRTDSIKRVLVLQEEVDPLLVNRAVTEGYAPDPSQVELTAIGRDPFLVAYALVNPGGRCVVTTEGSRPNRKRANRHMPDVCGTFGIDVCTTFELTRRLNFSTQWRRPPAP